MPCALASDSATTTATHICRTFAHSLSTKAALRFVAEANLEANKYTEAVRVCGRCGLCYDDEFDVCAMDGAALEPSLVGTRILAGRYRLEKQLAEGAMGQVFEAVHLAVGSRVAVKVMQPQQKDVRVAVQRFHKEARILGAVKHPHAVLITDFDVDQRASGAVAFLVTELLRGQSLASLLDDKRVLSLDEVERIVTPLAEAVEEAHALGIIHRDLKPSNVFLERLRDGTDVVKVLDFGIAKLLSRVGDDVPAPISFAGHGFDDSAVDGTLRDEILAALDDDGGDATRHERFAAARSARPRSPTRGGGSTWAGMMVGTVPYMAAEQMTGERTTRRADVHALAVLVFEMLSGQLPFDGDDDEIIRLKLSDERPSLVEHGVDAGVELDALLMRCFAVDADERPERVSAIAEAVARAAAVRRGAMTDPVHTLALRLSTTARALSRLQDIDPADHDVARDLLLSAGNALSRARAILPLARRALSAPPQTALVSAQLELDDVVTNVRAPLVRVAAAHVDSGAQLMLMWRRLDAVVGEVAAILDDEVEEDSGDVLAHVLEPQQAERVGLPWEVLVDQLAGRDPLDAHSALDTIVNDRVDETVRALHAGGAVAGRLLDILWRHADALLLHDLGAERGALRFVPFLAGIVDERGRFARVIEVLRDRSGVGIVDTVTDSADDEPLLRCLLLHPITEVRARAAARVALPALWTVVEHASTPLAVQSLMFAQLKKRGHTDHLKVFFFCVRESIAGATSSELREAVQLVRGFFEVAAFHEDIMFEPLLDLERILRERAGAAGLLDDSYAHAVAVFVDEGSSDESPLEHLRDVPLPLQRKLAREGRFLTTFVCHANERIAKETVQHLLRRDDVTRYLRLVTIHRAVLVELAKRRRFFKKDAPKLALLSNPKTPAGIARNYIGLVADEQLRVLSSNRHINPDIRRLIQQRLARELD